MNYLSAKEAAEKWGISQRRVAVLCSENRIPQAAMVGNMWIIPADAKKPSDLRSSRYRKGDPNVVKPFLKWAGGKGQLLCELQAYYPFKTAGITKYAEPFVGGGAVLFDILNHYKVEQIYISDINAELIHTYCMVRDHADKLVELLSSYQAQYLPLSPQERKAYYAVKRDAFNRLTLDDSKQEGVEKAALMIFLNKTCFNGLYRVNKKGFFNVPVGAYQNPLICDEDNLRAVSAKLQQVTIVCADYRKSAHFIDEHTFVYLDPPYRPLSGTANFTAYTQQLFDDDRQRELAEFVQQMDQKGAKIVVSNSDPQNIDCEDDFFDRIYPSQTITRVQASRMINSNSRARGKVNELIISNF